MHIVSEEDSLEVVLGAMHGACAAGNDRKPGGKPLEIICDLPVQPRGNGVYRVSVADSLPRLLDRNVQRRRMRLPQQTVNVLDAASEQGVELRRVLGLMVVAVPPEPVAPFGDHELAERFLQSRWSRCLLLPGAEEAAGCRQKLPSAVFLRMSDPGRQISEDPAAGNDASELLSMRLHFQELREGHGAQTLVVCQAPVKSA